MEALFPTLLLQAESLPADAVRETERFEWLSAPPGWVALLVIVPAVLLFVVTIYRKERATGGPLARWTLIALRSAVIFGVIAMLAEPVWRLTEYFNRHSIVLVLVDDSLSMDIDDKYSNRELVDKLAEFFSSTPENIEDSSRYELVQRLFRDPEIGFLDSLREKGNVHVASFSSVVQRLREIERKDGEAEALTDEERDVLVAYDELRGTDRVRQTRLADSLLDAVTAARGAGFTGERETIAGVLLITDGQQTAGSRAPVDAARRLGRRGIPIYALGVGNPDDAKDIRVEHLESNDVVLAADRVPFDAIISADGFEGQRVRVDLKFDGVLVDSEHVTLEGGGKRHSVRLVHKPPAPGEFRVQVEVEPQSGELFEENNVGGKTVRVLEQKIRVLYAEGPPRWEYRFLKNALIRDKTMETQVYLFSADKEFIQEGSEGMPPLRAFPRTREELFQYHVIILGDVDISREMAEQDLTEEQIVLLKEFVEEGGGGVVFVSGFHANPMKYLHTELYSLLPVEVPETSSLGEFGREPVTESFNVQLTPVGREHTVMRLDNEFERNTALWENPEGRFLENLPGFYWFSPIGPEKAGAVVLARHPTRLHPIAKKGQVIFSFMNYGKGRTFFSAVDSTWRWRAGVANAYFYRFWGQVVRFCASGRLLGKTQRYSISTDKNRYALGETIDIECRVFDANMKPTTEATVTVYKKVEGDDGEVVQTIELEEDKIRGQGTYRGTIPAERVGLHEVWLGTELERLAFQVFEVQVPALELRDPRLNRPLLQDLAARSGGRYFDLPEVPELVKNLEAVTKSMKGDIEDDPLWDDTWLLLAITGLLASEWILRRLVRLL